MIHADKFLPLQSQYAKTRFDAKDQQEIEAADDAYGKALAAVTGDDDFLNSQGNNVFMPLDQEQHALFTGNEASLLMAFVERMELMSWSAYCQVIRQFIAGRKALGAQVRQVD